MPFTASCTAAETMPTTRAVNNGLVPPTPMDRNMILFQSMTSSAEIERGKNVVNNMRMKRQAATRPELGWYLMGAPLSCVAVLDRVPERSAMAATTASAFLSGEAEAPVASNL